MLQTATSRPPAGRWRFPGGLRSRLVQASGRAVNDQPDVEDEKPEIVDEAGHSMRRPKVLQTIPQTQCSIRTPDHREEASENGVWRKVGQYARQESNFPRLLRGIRGLGSRAVRQAVQSSTWMSWPPS